jgi:SNF2 family DNA or RNA helicase
MEILNNRALVFRTRTPNKYNIIPKSKVFARTDGGYDVAVHWNLDEVRVLRNLGVKNVPSPIYKDYNWPGRYTPMEHQKETAAFLTLNRRAFVLSEPGTGKTISALWAADYLMGRGEIRRVLVLCPLSIMQAAWVRDIGNSIIHRSVVVAHHSKSSRRIELIQQDYEFVIVNYDGLALIADEVRNDGRFDLVIADEANAYKNPQTQRWRALNSILRPETLLWMMTGTPASQSPVDAYGLAKLVNASGVPKFYTAWRDMVMNKITMFKWAPKSDAAEKVHKALQPAIRHTKAQCLDLPPVLTTTRTVELTPQQSKYYRMLKERMLIETSGSTVTAVNAATSLNKLLQISTGVAYTDNQETIEFDATPRLNVLLEALEQTERKVIIFALFRAAIDTISAFLLKNGIVSEEIHGGVTATRRADIIHRFQTQAEPRVLVMQPQATAHGVTLTAADTVIFYGPLMSVEQYVQCIARSDRKGQMSDKVTVIHIEGSPIEKKMFKALASKVSEHALIVGLFNEEIKERGLTGFEACV